MTQETFDIIEIICLVVGLLINLLTVIFIIVYTNKTYSIAKSTRKTVTETAAMAKITAESFDVSEKILIEMKETRDAQISPYVFAYFDHIEKDNVTKLFLVIKNAGKGIARDIKINIEPDLQNDNTYSLKHIKQIINNMPPLPPSGEIRHAFALTTQYFKATPPLPQNYKIQISFKGGINKSHRIVEQVISLDFFQGSRLNRIIERQTKG
jgi:hypothetical protein